MNIKILSFFLIQFSITLLLHAEDSFIGNWKIEVIASPMECYFSHDETSTIITIIGASIDQEIIIDD